MPKLPKKKTMLEVIKRVAGYTNKLLENKKITTNQFIKIRASLIELEKAIDK